MTDKPVAERGSQPAQVQGATAYIIENDEGLAWSNADGWTDGDDYETFSAHQQQTLRLPIGGHWVGVPWRFLED
jgi:hypothetical protein